MRPVAFVWDNFGPMHVDRVEAVATAFAGSRRVTAIEICGTSDVYDWISEDGISFRKTTLFPNQRLDDIGTLQRAYRIIRACLHTDASDIFLCHYDHLSTLFAAIALRFLGRNPYAMGCSKFDDKPRIWWRESLKSFFYLPYRGGISSGRRAKDYMRFLGIAEARIATEYNTVSIARIRKLANSPSGAGRSFDQRHFTIIARLIHKKNIAMALEAFAIYARATSSTRSLHVCGSGPLEAELRLQANKLGLTSTVHFHGFVQTDEIAKILNTTLALILPSVEEQFGNVVIEAQAVGVPVILSDNCGARDILVRSGVNGFVVEPDNPVGLAYFMKQIGGDEQLWQSFSKEAELSSLRGDVSMFSAAVSKLLESRP